MKIHSRLTPRQRQARRYGHAPASSIISAGLLADYRFNEGSGTTVLDHSGNGHNATFAVGNAPTWVTGGVHFAADQWLTTPLTTSQALTIQALVQFDSTLYGQYCTIIGDSANSWGFWLKTDGYTGLTVNISEVMALLATWAPGFTASSSQDFITPGMTAVLSQTSSSGSDAFYVNNNAPQVGNAASSLSVRTGNLEIGGSSFYSTNPSVGMKGTLARLLLYSTTLSQANVATNYAAMAAAAPAGWSLPNYSPSTSRICATEGDSITAGLGLTTGQFWPQNMSTSSLSHTYDLTNFGIAGQTLATMNASGFDKIKMKYAPAGPKNVVVIFGGTNDLCTGTFISPAATFAILQALVAKYESQGWKVVIVPMISRGGTGYSGSTCDSLMASYNAMIWGASWDSNVKFVPANDPSMGSGGSTNFFGAGFNTNSTYIQSDLTHPTAAGGVQIQNGVATQVNAFG